MTQAQKLWLTFVSVSGFLVVALGAFAAHGLQPYLDEKAQDWFELATRYQMWHTLALLGLVATLLERNAAFRLAAWAWALGILLFSGSLYMMAITGQTALAWITPLGGTAFLIGWSSLLVGSFRLQEPARKKVE
ncbi:DUF423 domain-containing protein [Marinospirillum sp.]|uniref:DUF423 domain-containing protein n=1 Tax=Marinospirillum sp. TaxID=2183934 RepID=UPI0028707949|nr:DUF423 domain-containing protein [Marinospirillum sp.]MDR9469333.1 DUF423 domain-containing protein [Marinospirillum sp.]